MTFELQFHSRHYIKDIDHGLKLIAIGAINRYQIGMYRFNQRTQDDIWCTFINVERCENNYLYCTVTITINNTTKIHRKEYILSSSTKKYIDDGFKNITIYASDHFNGNQIVYRSF